MLKALYRTLIYGHHRIKDKRPEAIIHCMVALRIFFFLFQPIIFTVTLHDLDDYHNNRVDMLHALCYVAFMQEIESKIQDNINFSSYDV